MRTHPSASARICALAGGCELLRFIYAERAEDGRRGALYDLKALGQKGRIPVVKLDIVTGGSAHFQSHGLSHDERHGFCLSLTDNLSCERPALAAMQKLVRSLVNESGEFFWLGLSGEQGDSAPVADAQGGCDALVEFK